MARRRHKLLEQSVEKLWSHAELCYAIRWRVRGNSSVANQIRSIHKANLENRSVSRENYFKYIMYTLVKKQEKRNKSPIQFHKNYIVIQGVSLENIRYTKYFTKLSVKIFSVSLYSLDPSGISY
jgi:hypothetical protein